MMLSRLFTVIWPCDGEMNNNDERPGRIDRSGRFFSLSVCLICLVLSFSLCFSSFTRADYLDDNSVDAPAMIPVVRNSEVRIFDELDPTAATEDALAGSAFNTGDRLVFFAATGSTTRNVVTVQWETMTEPWIYGYYVWRGEKHDGVYVRIHHQMLASRGGDTWGGLYTFDDYGVVSGRTYYYKVQEIETNGLQRFYGPVASDGSTDCDHCSDNDKVLISCFIGSLLF